MMESANNKGEERRWKLPAIICLFLVLMCGVTFGASTVIARADTAGVIGNVTYEGPPDDSWYEIKNDGERLSVFLVSRVNGYEWRYGSSNDNLRQLRRHEVQEYEEYDPTERDDDYNWEVHLTPGSDADGETELTFVCVRDTESSSVDTKTIKVFIEDGKIIKIE